MKEIKITKEISILFSAGKWIVFTEGWRDMICKTETIARLYAEYLVKAQELTKQFDEIMPMDIELGGEFFLDVSHFDKKEKVNAFVKQFEKINQLPEWWERYIENENKSKELRKLNRSIRQ